MSLPSQSTRASRSAGVSYRQSRSNPIRKLATPAIIVGVLAAIVWFATRPSGGVDPDRVAQATGAGGVVDDRGEPVGDAERADEERDEAPVVIDQSAPPRPLPGAPRREPEVVDAGAEGGSRDSGSGGGVGEEGPSVETPALETPIERDPRRSESLLTNTLRRAETGQGAGSGADASIAPIERARALIVSGRRVEARRNLSDALRDGGLSGSERAAVRGLLSDINSVLVFGPVASEDDPITEEYTVRSGDSLSRIAARRELATHWKLIQRVNRIANPSRIRLGQTLKLVRGPFHAVVHKSAHRMDLYHGSPADPDSWVFIRSVRVGLGIDDGTPDGRFRVSNQLENPGWVNPRDGTERYEPDNPENPIGEFWIGLEGVGGSASLTGYGIHGTIEPDSIGRNDSMGCVRLAEGDIEVVYELLAPGVSLVEIRP